MVDAAMKCAVVVLAFITLGVTASAPTRAFEDGPAKTPEKSLAGIVEQLPGIMKLLHLAPMKSSVHAFPGPDPVYGYSKVRIARLIAPESAKITLGFVLPGEGKVPDDEYGTISLYLTWYQSRWTVTKHECSSRFSNGSQHDTLLKLIAAVDEISN